MKPFITQEISDTLKAQWEAEERLFKDWLHQGQVFQDAPSRASMPANAQSNNTHLIDQINKAHPVASQSVLLNQVRAFYEWAKTQGESPKKPDYADDKTAVWQTHFNLRAAAAAHVEIPWYAIDMALTSSVHIVITPCYRQSCGEVDINLRPVAGKQQDFLDRFSPYRGQPLSVSVMDNGLPVIVSEGCVHPSGLSIEAEGYLLNDQRPMENNLQLCITHTT